MRLQWEEALGISQNLAVQVKGCGIASQNQLEQFPEYIFPAHTHTIIWGRASAFLKEEKVAEIIKPPELSLFNLYLITVCVAVFTSEQSFSSL